MCDSARYSARALSLLVMLAVLLSGAAQAQVFHRSDPRLTKADMEILFSSIRTLLATRNVGEVIEWENPESEHGGSATLHRVYQSDDMPCGTVRVHSVVETRSREFQMNWCLHEGTWKIAD